MPRLTIPALQGYCRAAEAVVTFKRNTDIFTVTAEELRCLYMSDRSAPLDPRIVFKNDKGIAYIEESELVPIAGEGMFREQQVLKGGALSPNFYRQWNDVVEAVESHVRAHVSHSEPTLHELLEGYGACSAEDLAKAEAEKQDGETLGMALVRLRILKIEDLIKGAIGVGRHFKPKNHGANDVGRQLVAKNKLQPAELKNALSKQVRMKAPLGQVLLDMNLVKPEDLEKFEPPAIALPDFDQPGEYLCRNNKITRSELLHYTLRATKRSSTIIAELVTEQKVSAEDADMVQRIHDCKARLRLEGKVRLGEVLIEKGLLTEDKLIDRLAYQVDHTAPLGALLVAGKLVTPEQLIEALQQQDERLTELAKKEAKKEAKKAAAAPPPTVHIPEPPRSQPAPPKPLKIRELATVLLVLTAMGWLALYQYKQMTKLASDKPDPYASEPIDPIFSFFAGDQSKAEEPAFFTAEDLENNKKQEVDRAKELDPQYAEQVDRLGVTKKNQDSEVDALLAGDSSLLPTPTPAPVEEVPPQAALPAETQAPQVATLPPAGAPGQAALPPPQPAFTPVPAAPAVPSRPVPAGVIATPALPAAAAPQPARAPAAPAPAAPTARPAVPVPVQTPPPAARPPVPVQPAQLAAPAAPPPGATRVAAAPAAPAAQPAAPAQQGGQPAAPVVTPKPLPPDKALNMQALADMAAGAPQKARDALAKAADIAQDNPVIIFNLGVADYKLGQFAPAARSFNKSRQLYEGSKSDLDRKVKQYEEMDALPGGSERPFKLMRAMIRANTLLADTVTYQGKAREGLGEVMDARRFYREAAGLYRESAVLYNRMGDLYRRGGDVKGAVQSYAQAAKADPRYAEPWKQLSLIAVDQKKPDLANKYLAIYRRLSGQ